MTILRTVICLLFVSVAAHAQLDVPDDRLQIRGVVGWSGFVDESVLHHGVLGVASDVRLVGGLRVGPEVLYQIGPDRDRDFTIIPVVGYDFRRLERITPFVNGGFGLIAHNAGFGWRSSYTFGVGGGVKIAITDRLFIAPEGRLGWEPFSRATISIGYRF